MGPLDGRRAYLVGSETRDSAGTAGRSWGAVCEERWYVGERALQTGRPG